MIAERLRSAREFRGLSQQALADLAGISLRSQQNYEAGSRAPDSEYFELLASLGIDILFILTGQANSSALSPDETMLMQLYRAASPAAKGAALGALVGALQGPDQVLSGFASSNEQLSGGRSLGKETAKPTSKRTMKPSE